MDGMVASAYALIAAGILLVAAFIYVNFSLEKKWFSPAAAEAPENRSTHKIVGVAEVALFSIGVVLVTAGFVILGTYRPLVQLSTA